MKLTFKQSGYIYLCYLNNGQHVVISDTGEREIWVANKNHASFGLVYKNTHLEFVRSWPIF